MTLWTKPVFQNLISIHPVKQPENMLSVHHFYKTLDFQEDYERLHETADYLNRLCKQLPAHAAPPLSTSAGCDLKVHPHLAYFNFSSKLNHQGLAPSGFLVHREKVPFFLKPVDKFDVEFWTRFNDSLVQEMGAISPEFSPQGSLIAEISHILGMLRPYIRTQHAPQAIEIKHILDGYTRFNPHLGREYIFTFKLAVGKSASTVYKKYHVVREIGPQVAVVDLSASSAKETVHVILPLEKVDKTFMEFLKSLGHVGLKYKSNAVHLVVVVFSDGIAEAVEKMLREFTANTFPLSVSVATGSGDFSSLRAYDIGMATLDDTGLAFLACVNLRFATGFFRRCRSNAELGKRVYFPSGFWLYQFDYANYTDGSVPPITSWTGQWASYDFSMACIHKRDYDAVGGYRKRTYTIELFRAVVSSHLDVMQAPEPGLFKVWGGKKCWKVSSAKRRKICSGLQRKAEFEQTDLAEYLGELSSLESNIINNKLSLSQSLL